ncbi:MAG: hypothetical protein QOC71_1698 [Thermoplasmata archaeon]|jgi:SAM-dependent methyltransferase|nr:hypothetical protein [Thermoplasmata archaeon]
MVEGRQRADYGIDAPGVVANLAAIGGAGLALAAGGLFLPLGGAGQALASLGLFVGLSFAVTAALMVLSSRVGKRRFRDHLLDGLALAGDERVLDVGCGRGLLLVGAAKRLPRGLAVGLDLWSAKDQSGNRSAATLENARRAGVAPRLAVATGDMRSMPLPHAAFDAVVSNLAVHNVPTVAGRAEAVREMARVVRPGGLLAIADFQKTAEYEAALRGLGWTDIRRTAPSPWQFPLVRTVLARRPGTSPARGPARPRP